jgi:hypothetical protein
MFNAAVFADEADVIPFAGREKFFRIIRCDQVIEAARGKFGRFAIGMIWIVIDLHLGPRPIRVSRRFADAVKNAAIGAFGDFPIEGQFKVFELLAGYQIRAWTFDAFEGGAVADPVRWK